ncbi:SCO family protein [Balneolaceae bacterium YR4-1]|uniref:SCO family protein n=1 Tax=Halalkalibaculum roseum TaxID=2709311 RepID=A0A6M1T329_9BACT|nr:SCO family protein [Halalkalibaculum roseum]NGP77137.1 SCO family protein [Halalkalibaculum roseum]
MKSVGLAVFVACMLLHPISAEAQLNKQKPKDVQDVGIEEHLGDKIPLDLMFATSEGDSVTLASLMKGDKPVLLNPVYYECPMLCSMVIEAVYSGVSDLKWTPGDEYNIITFSIDPEEDSKLAASTKDSMITKLGRDNAREGWYFLTGNEKSIRTLTEAIGFKYKKVEEQDQFAHSAAIMFLSPDGTLTRYLYGIEFDEFNLRNALYEAADGEVGSVTERVLLYCYQYDPDSNSYVAVAWRIMQLGGFATALILGIFIGLLWLKEKNSKNDKNIKITNGSS